MSDPSLWGLPAKFAWAVTDGGDLGLDGIAADVRFEAVTLEGATVFAISLADTRESVAVCRPDDVPAVAATLAWAFLDACAARDLLPHRMHDLLALCGPQPIVARALGAEGSVVSPSFSPCGRRWREAPDEGSSVQTIPSSPLRGPSPAGGEGLTPGHAGAAEGLPRAIWSMPAVHSRSPIRVGGPSIGLHRAGSHSWIYVAPPFGRLEAGTLDHFAAELETVGASQIRLTPWRTMAAPGLPEPAATLVWGRLVDGGSGPSGGALILDPDDPRLRVAACAGAPACPRATTPVQADAARLAAQLPPGRRGTQLHVSGCAKGCAHAGAAPITLVGHDGGYDLVRNGKASDAPERTTLSIESIVAMLRMSDRVPGC